MTMPAAEKRWRAGQGAMTGGPVPAGPAEARVPRSEGCLRVAFKRRGDATVLDSLFQSGCLKARLLRSGAGTEAEAVLLNTAGGLTGGDRLAQAFAWGEGARAVVTTQACEKIYRAADGVARVTTTLDVAPGAVAEWLPQETIIYDRAGLDRDLAVRLGVGAVFTGVEAMVLGRTAMGEAVRRGDIRDGWRLWRGGRLVYADALRLKGDIACLLARAPATQGAIAFASVLHAGPAAETARDAVRDLLDDNSCAAAASAWNGLLAVRFVAHDNRSLRRGLVAVLNGLRAGRAMPRVWQC